MQHSIEKAKWSGDREEYFRKQCQLLARNLQRNLLVDGNTVLLGNGGGEEELWTTVDPRRLWYETFLALKNSEYVAFPGQTANTPILEDRQ